MNKMKSGDKSVEVNVNKLSLDLTCRTCLSTDKEQQLIPIFQDVRVSHKFVVSDQLLLLKIRVAKDDGYPPNICGSCMEWLDAVEAFRNQCHRAQEHLEQHFPHLPKHKLGMDANNESLKLLDKSGNIAPQIGNKNEVRLASHKENTKSTEISTDNECAVNLFDTSEFQNHLKTRRNSCKGFKKVYKCRHCNELFSNLNLYESHELTHMEKQSYLCNICGKNFFRESSLKLHLKYHDSNKERFVCGICEKQFLRKASLKIHLDIHLNKRAYQCEQCGLKFNHQNTLKGHMRLHNTKKSYHCEFCEESFLRNHDLKRHRLMVHNRTEASVQIELQPLQKSDGATMKTIVMKEENPPKKRRKRPTEYKPYCCDLCGKSFKIPSALNNHAKIHSEDRKYVCKECGDAFRNIVHLQNHINAVHLKQKPYNCEVCKKSFARVGDRNRHRQMHSTSKPHQCAACGKSFAWTRSLQAHIRDHTGEKPYVCVICKAGFSRHENLARHTRIAHIEVEMNIRKGKTISTTKPIVYDSSTVERQFNC